MAQDNAYVNRHNAVRRARGRAAEHDCVDCDQPAAEWSQVHDTDGTHVEDYEPRCIPCHSRYDGIGEQLRVVQRQPEAITRLADFNRTYWTPERRAQWAARTKAQWAAKP